MKLLFKTNICKICLEKTNLNSFNNLFFPKNFICDKCQQSFSPVFKKFSVNGVEALFIYKYDSTTKELLYKFKGCFDFELKDVFLQRFSLFLKLKYFDCSIVHAPSYIDSDVERGFNHVVEMFKPLKLKQLDVLIKTANIKQANCSFIDRKNIKNIIEIKNLNQVKGKNILLVDDVYTTGSTMRACIDLLKQAGAKTIKILVMSKTEETKTK